jgi:hypothetical protein
MVMIRASAAARALLLLLTAGRCDAQSAAPQITAEAVEVRRIPAREANQGVAADDRFLYVIDNQAIGKYEKANGARAGGWSSPDDGPIQHLNAGIVREGRLHVAHSNYPGVPMVSSIEIFDVETMRHVDSHSFGVHGGSATWIDFHDGFWWVAFVNYDNRGGVPGRGVEWSTVERFDAEWRQTGGWVFPAGLIERFRPYSNSGGFWSADGQLYLTGHDAAEIYTMRLPTAGSTLEWTGTIAAPIAGQGIAGDPIQTEIVYAIDRGRREVIVVKMPEVR